MTDNQDGTYTCDKCQQEMELFDQPGQQDAICINECCPEAGVPYCVWMDEEAKKEAREES